MGLGAPKQAPGRSGGVSRERVRALETSRGGQNAKNAILEPLSFFPKRSRAYIYNGFSVFLKKHVFFKFGSDGFSRGAREGAETCVWPLRNFQGGPRKSGSGPRGPFLGGPGSAKVRQGFNFEVNPGLVLTT